MAPPQSCSLTDQKSWLSNYMAEWYFWNQLAPRADEAAFPSVDSYFKALLYTGGTAPFPTDRYSYTESTESYNRFFGNGQTLGFGVSVAGLEVTGQPGQPLFVRYVEALSPAAAAGVQRGDELLSANGRPAADLIGSNDFSPLTASSAGQSLALVLRRAGVQRNVNLNAAVFALSPVPLDSVVTTPGGRKLGYVVVKDMVSQVNTPLDAAFARIKAAGVDAVVLDLRYNGGGLVSVGGTVASYVAGSRGAGQTYASLLYNEQRATNNNRFAFSNPAAALGSARVYVLTGPRTCSASEQLINGLRGVGVEVVAIGASSCGKPVGFLPSAQCGTTFSAVNFESVNARGEGRYFTGFAPTCAVAETYSRSLGDSAEPLLATALRYADSGACPSPALNALPPRNMGTRLNVTDERQQMLAR